MTEHDVMVQMMREIVLGREWGYDGTRVEQTEQNRKVWRELEVDISKAKKNGMVVDVPPDTEVW